MRNDLAQFLFANMQEMEIELRAQSITLDALGAGIISVEDLQDALTSARGSDAMLDYVEAKYQYLRSTLPLAQPLNSEEELIQLMEAATKNPKYRN